MTGTETEAIAAHVPAAIAHHLQGVRSEAVRRALSSPGIFDVCHEIQRSPRDLMHNPDDLSAAVLRWHLEQHMTELHEQLKALLVQGAEREQCVVVVPLHEVGVLAVGGYLLGMPIVPEHSATCWLVIWEKP